MTVFSQGINGDFSEDHDDDLAEGPDPPCSDTDHVVGRIPRRIPQRADRPRARRPAKQTARPGITRAHGFFWQHVGTVVLTVTGFEDLHELGVES